MDAWTWHIRPSRQWDHHLDSRRQFTQDKQAALCTAFEGAVSARDRRPSYRENRQRANKEVERRHRRAHASKSAPLVHQPARWHSAPKDRSRRAQYPHLLLRGRPARRRSPVSAPGQHRLAAHALAEIRKTTQWALHIALRRWWRYTQQKGWCGAQQTPGLHAEHRGGRN